MKDALYTLLAFLLLIFTCVYYYAVAVGVIWVGIELLRCVWTGPILIGLAFLLWVHTLTKSKRND